METDAESGDDVRGVSSRAAVGVRVVHGSCQRGAGFAETRGAERFGSGARRVVDGAGVQAPSRRKQRGMREGDVGDGRFVNKLNFKLQFVNSIFLSIPKVK